VRHKVAVLHRHCADVGRDPGDISVTNMTSTQVVSGLERPAANAGTTEELIGRYRAYAESGVQTAIVSLSDVADGGIERFATVIEAFR
jgi:enoyl reductase-like protein